MIVASRSSIYDGQSTSDCSAEHAIAVFAARYPERTAAQYRQKLGDLYASNALAYVHELNEAHVIAWVTQPNKRTGKRIANNTARARLATVRSWCRWSVAQRYMDSDPTALLQGFGHPLRSQTNVVYGRQQAPTPARWLSYEDSFGTLIDACHDGTAAGARDALVIRLGLLGLRAHEIGKLAIQDMTDGSIRFVGKGNKPAQVPYGPGTAAALAEYLSWYPPRDQGPDRPLVCVSLAGRKNSGALDRPILWGRWTTDTQRYRSIRHSIGFRAELAGLGSVAPHDLRRTAAGLLHADTDHSGAHRYDLRDIQVVLRHADPATTARCYLDPLNTGAKDRAARRLD